MHKLYRQTRATKAVVAYLAPMNTIDGAVSSATRKSSLTSLGPSPRYLCARIGAVLSEQHSMELTLNYTGRERERERVRERERERARKPNRK